MAPHTRKIRKSVFQNHKLRGTHCIKIECMGNHSLLEARRSNWKTEFCTKWCHLEENVYNLTKLCFNTILDIIYLLWLSLHLFNILNFVMQMKWEKIFLTKSNTFLVWEWKSTLLTTPTHVTISPASAWKYFLNNINLPAYRRNSSTHYASLVYNEIIVVNTVLMQNNIGDKK